MALALTIGILVGVGVSLLYRRGMLRIVIGFMLLSHGVNLLIIAAGGVDRRGAPLGADPDPAVTADPLPQAFVLTAIVISFAITMYMLVLAVIGERDDDTGIELAGRENEVAELVGDDPVFTRDPRAGETITARWTRPTGGAGHAR